MRTWWQLLRQRGLLGSGFVRGRRGAGIYISDRALRLAAEVLEPRCLLTDATGLAANDGGGDILVDASQWDDAGLTLLRDGDLVHLVRTGTTQDVIAPFAADAPGQLIIQGRDDVSDVLTIDVTGLMAPAGDSYGPPSKFVKRIMFDGGSGVGTDELRVMGNFAGFLQFTVYPHTNGDWSSVDVQDNFEAWMYFNIYYRHVESIEQTVVAERLNNHIDFSEINNEVAIENRVSDGVVSVTDQASGIVIQASSSSPLIGFFVDGGAGDDQITVISPPTAFWYSNVKVSGGDGNDTLIGGDGGEELLGNAGNDSIYGGNGDDAIRGGFGDDTIDGGQGSDSFGEDELPIWNLDDVHNVYLGANTLEGFGTDHFVNIELVCFDVGTGTRVDASAFIGSVELFAYGGANTLIGGAGDDLLYAFEGGHNLLIGGGGNDLLQGGDSLSDTLDGGSGNDTINGVADVDETGDAIPNATQILIVPPPANTLLGQGLDEPRDEDATLPQTLVTDAESDGEDSGLNELDGQESNPADENDSTETASTTWDDSLTNRLLTDELLDGDEPT